MGRCIEVPRPRIVGERSEMRDCACMSGCVCVRVRLVRDKVDLSRARSLARLVPGR